MRPRFAVRAGTEPQRFLSLQKLIARARFEWSRFSPWMIVRWSSWLTSFVYARLRSRQFAMMPHTIRSVRVAVLSGSLIFLAVRCARWLYLPRRPDLLAEALLGEGGAYICFRQYSKQ